MNPVWNVYSKCLALSYAAPRATPRRARHAPPPRTPWTSWTPKAPREARSPPQGEPRRATDEQLPRMQLAAGTSVFFAISRSPCSTYLRTRAHSRAVLSCESQSRSRDSVKPACAGVSFAAQFLGDKGRDRNVHRLVAAQPVGPLSRCMMVASNFAPAIFTESVFNREAPLLAWMRCRVDDGDDVCQSESRRHKR